MENHPIPQDVTGFKFKLIGSVTVKQFLYILGGGILALVCFILPISYLIKLPLTILFGGLGALIAFVPIEGRPMDVMLKNFLKALPAENQYIYRKKGAGELINNYFTPKPATPQKKEIEKTTSPNPLNAKRALLYSALRKAQSTEDGEGTTLATINSFLNESQHTAGPPVQKVDEIPKSTQIAQPVPTPIVRTDDAIKIATPDLTSLQPKESVIPKPAPAISQPDTKPSFENTDREILDMKKFATQQPSQTEQPSQNPIPTPQPVTTIQPQGTNVTPIAPNESKNVTTINSSSTLKAGFPQLPDTPNVVLGIIKDPRGKILPNILVEIMNTQGIPVRAFKTNALGQFAAATPLPDGEYNILLEDPRKQHEFEQIKIVLEGKLFEPLEIYSVDQREKLRRELFGGSQIAQSA